MSARDVIANWLWSEADLIDFDDMGQQAGGNIITTLAMAGYVIAPKDPTSAMIEAGMAQIRSQPPTPSLIYRVMIEAATSEN